MHLLRGQIAVFLLIKINVRPICKLRLWKNLMTERASDQNQPWQVHVRFSSVWSPWSSTVWRLRLSGRPGRQGQCLQPLRRLLLTLTVVLQCHWRSPLPHHESHLFHRSSLLSSATSNSVKKMIRNTGKRLSGLLHQHSKRFRNGLCY